VFSGQIAIDRAGGPAPAVEIQDRTPTGWVVIATATPAKSGSFRVLYRASRLTIGYAFSIRAVTAGTALWQGAATPAITATVRG